jgi:sec-independent protein translocase protein TatA
MVPLALLDFGPTTLLILGVLAILLFGERLPEVGRTFGKKIMGFKRSIQGIQEEFRSAAQSVTSEITDTVSSSSSTSYDGSPSSSSPRPAATYDDSDHDVTTAPKFVPPAAEPPAAGTF